MDLELLLQSLIAKSDVALYVLSALGTLVVLGAAYVKLTPNQEDDAVWKKLEDMAVVGVLLKLLVKFSPIARKEKE